MLYLRLFKHHRGLSIHVSRASGLCECINMVRWKGSLSFGIRRIYHLLLEAFTIASWSFSCTLCALNCIIVWTRILCEEVSSHKMGTIFNNSPFPLSQILIAFLFPRHFNKISPLSSLLVLWLWLWWKYRKVRRHCQGSSVLQKRLKSVSSVNTNTDTAIFDDKDFISWQNDAVRYVEIDRVTTV